MLLALPSQMLSFAQLQTPKLLQKGTLLMAFWLPVLQRITAYNPQLNAISFINPNLVNDATQKDTALKAYIANGTALPSLFCVPIIAKVSVLCMPDRNLKFNQIQLL